MLYNNHVIVVHRCTSTSIRKPMILSKAHYRDKNLLPLFFKKPWMATLAPPPTTTPIIPP